MEPLKLDPSAIQVLYEIGQGEYGSVLKGTWTSDTGEKVWSFPRVLFSDLNTFFPTAQSSAFR